MIMRARNEGKVVIFELEGHLDFETTQQMEDTCINVLQKNASQQIVFNLEKLKFVGSSGINQFIDVLKEFNSLPEKPRFCQVSAEFAMMFKAYQTSRNPFEVFENEGDAIASFERPMAPKPKKASKKRTLTQ